MQKLLVFQSLWAMERRHADGYERSLEENIADSVAAGFDGISAHYTSRRDVVRLNEAIRGTGLKIEGVCFPRTVEDLRLTLELATHPERLAAIKAKLAANRLTTPLFDSEGFTRDFERALESIRAS